MTINQFALIFSLLFVIFSFSTASNDDDDAKFGQAQYEKYLKSVSMYQTNFSASIEFKENYISQVVNFKSALSNASSDIWNNVGPKYDDKEAHNSGRIR
jgi:hypothetical protein